MAATRVGLVRRADLDVEWTSVQLRSPRTDQVGEYFLSADGTQLAEVFETDGARSSWFVGNAVQRDGGMCVVMPINAVFMMLPLLLPAEARKKTDRRARFCTIEQLLEENNATALMRVASLKDLEHVCDTQTIDDIGDLYRINHEKLLAWLQGRVRAVADQLPALASVSMAQRASPLETAVQLVAEHVPEHIEEMLRESLADALAAQAPSTPTVFDPAKAALTRPLEDYGTDAAPNGPPQKKAKQSTQQRALAEQAKGMRAMTSFFTKKA